MSEHLAHHRLRAVEPTHVRGVRQPSLTLCIMEKLKILRGALWILVNTLK